jgi:5-formyltetrahydrofolate cyclo-ligase
MKSIIKSDFRKKCIEKLKLCSKNNKIKSDKSICNKIEKIIKKNDAKNILFYIPLKIEVDIRNLLNKLRKEKKYNIYVPYMVGNTLKIVPYRLPLKKKKYKIKEPNNSFFKYKVSMDLAIVPIVGTDVSYRRVGYGAGFYDRYFSDIKQMPKIVFTQRCLCKATNILTLNHDIKADYIITA